MAKVITTELQHSGASGANVTLDSSKNVTCENNLQVDGNVTVTGTLPADKLTGALPAISGASLTGISSPGRAHNLIINGAFQIWQRGTSSNLVGYRTADRFKTSFAGTHEDPTRSKLALTSSDTGPWAAGFRNAYRITNGNQTSVEAGDKIKIEYKVEDQDLACSGWQAESTSSYLTMSFWLRSSVAQTYYVILESKHGTSKQYSFAATISSANTWTKITKTVPGHADISFGNDNGEGMDIYICPFVGTDESTSGHTLNSWKNTSGSDQVPDMTDTWYDTDDATFDLTGLQLEVGDTATDFEMRSYGDELLRCLRYYYRTGHGQSMANDTAIAQGYNRNTTTGQYTHTFPVPMRVPPTAIESTGTVTDYKISQLATGTVCDAVPTFDTANTLQAHIYFTVASGLTAGYGSRASTYNGAGKYIAFSAEL